MAGSSDYAATQNLNWMAGRAAGPGIITPYLGLFTVLGADDNTGFTEVSGGSYARKLISPTDFAAPSGSAPRQTSNSVQIAFAQATANWGTLVGFGFFDAVSGGNLILFEYLGGHAWKPFTGSNASPSVITAPGHGYSNADQVAFTAEFGGALPATGGSWSGLKTVAGVTTDTFTAGVNTTGTGSGMVRKVVTQDVPSGIRVVFDPGQLVIVQG